MTIQLKSVLISDPVDPRCSALLVKHGVSVCMKSKLSKDELIEELKNHDGLIVRSETKVTAEVIEASPNLKLIGRAGSGVDTIDVEAATRNGVVVLNTPGGNSISACELTCALISALARNVVQGGASLKEKRWDRKLYAGTELYGKTLGVIGFGNIGRLVAARMQAYGMKVYAYDPFLTPEVAQELQVSIAQLVDIWANADYITVHTPLIPQTRNLINAETLAQCKKGVRIINVARGGIVDEKALLDSIKAGHCAGAAIDVFVEEPPKNDVTWELIQHPKVIATPHLGASTAEAQSRVAVEIAEQFLAISGISTEFAVTGIVNAPALAATVSSENASWVDLSIKLGQIIGRFFKKNPELTLECTTTGDQLKSKKFISTALLLGLISKDRTGKRLNLVNVPSAAKDEGIYVKENHLKGNQNSVVVKLGNNTIKGTVQGDRAVLLAVNDCVFEHGVNITGYVSLYGTKTADDLEKVIKELTNKNVCVQSLNVFKNWIILQTQNEIFVSVPGLESY